MGATGVRLARCSGVVYAHPGGLHNGPWSSDRSLGAGSPSGTLRMVKGGKMTGVGELVNFTLWTAAIIRRQAVIAAVSFHGAPTT